jgi:PAS domain S-box-containing protein
MYLKEELYGLIKTDESIFDFIQESVLDGLWYWDLENPENEWMNQRFWMVLGYDPDEMPHKSNAWQNIINQNDLKVALENFSKHCENPNYPYDQVVRYTHKCGSMVWIRCRGLAIRDIDGKPIRMLGAHQDVSDIKNREQDLLTAIEIAKESEEKYRSMYNNAPLSYQSLDENGCFIDINPNWLETLGYDRNEVIGKWFGDFLHPDYVEHFRINFPEFKKRGFVSDIQFRLRRKDNAYIYVSFEGCIGLTPDGKFKQTYCVFKEITEQKALENALVKAKEKAEVSEEKYRLLYENAGLGIGYFNSEGKIISFNQVAAKFMNGNPEDFIGKSILDLYPKPAADLYLNRIQKAIISTEPVAYEDYVQLPKEEKWFLSTYTKIINTQDKVFGIQIISQDITLLKTTEIDLKKAKEKAEENENRYRGLINNINAGVVVHAADTSIIMSNTRANVLLGLNDEQIKGKVAFDSHWKFIAEDSTPISLDDYPVMRILKSKELIKHQMIGVCRSAEDIAWLMVNGFPVLDDNNEILEIVVSFIDITERKLADEKRRQSDERFRIAQDMSPDGFTILQPVFDAQNHVIDFIWVYENNAIAKLNGTDPQQVVGKRLLELFPGHRDTEFMKAYIQVAKTGKTITFEEGYSGESMQNQTWFRIVVVPMAENIAILAQDITARKNTELLVQDKSEEIAAQNEELNQANQELIAAKEKTEISEQYFKSLIENAPDGVVIIDESGKFIYVSPNAARLFGYDEKEVIGRSGDEYTHPDDLPRVFKVIETIMIDPSQKPSLIYRFKRKAGEYRWIESTFTNLLADKAIKGIILNFSDVTERKQLFDELVIAKEKAEVSQMKLESILENLQDALLQTDRNGNFIYVNSRASRMYGYSENELIGLPASNLYADTAERDRLIEKMKNEGKVFDWTGKGLRKDGSSFWVSMNVKFIIDNQGNIAGTEGIVRDITERKKAEETLKAKMEELDRFHKLTVGREITMVELKKEVNSLLNKSGLDNKYKIVE